MSTGKSGPTPRIAVVGSLNTDLVVRTPRMPLPGETLAGGDFFTAHGGKGANQAVAAARQGGLVAMIGCVGDDDFGAAHRAAMMAEGIDVMALRVVTGTKTGVAVILLDDQRQNSIVISPGANAALSPASIAKSALLIEQADALLCQMETPLPATEAAMKLARSAATKVVFNPAPASLAAVPLLALTDVLVVNETEAALFAETAVGDVDSAIRAGQSLLKHGPGIVLVTMGASGVVAVTATRASMHPGFRVTPVDTTAAGDTFAGSLGVALAQGMDLPEAVFRAQAAAALSVTRLGAQPSIPSVREVDAFLAAREAELAVSHDPS